MKNKYFNEREKRLFNFFSNKDDYYDPIAEQIAKLVFEADNFIEEYILEEEPNPIMDKDIKYKKASGEEGTIKVKDALRLKKDHPAHIQADKMLGSEKPEPKSDKKDKEGGEDKKGEKGKEGGEDKKEKGAETKKPEPEKLSGDELKSNAEKSPGEKNQEIIKQQLDKEKEKLSNEDKNTLDNMNNPESKERKGLLGALKNGMKAIGGGVKHMIQHKKEMIGGSINAVKSLATGGKLGMIKDDKGKDVHWSNFCKEDANGKPHMEDVPVYETDHHGHTKKDKDGNPIQSKDKKGNPITEKKPIFHESNSKEKELFEKSWAESKKQKKHLKDWL